MKLSVIFLTLGLAVLANGDYTNPQWVTGSLFSFLLLITRVGSFEMSRLQVEVPWFTYSNGVGRTLRKNVKTS